jgi:hypothetical protein
MNVPTELEQLPNVGPAIAGKLRRLGVRLPRDLYGRDPYQMYDEICRLEGSRVDPCVLDVFVSVIEFINGGRAKPWWKFTTQRKRRLKARQQNNQ